jgi:hypothetical protein
MVSTGAGLQPPLNKCTRAVHAGSHSAEVGKKASTNQFRSLFLEAACGMCEDQPLIQVLSEPFNTAARLGNIFLS